MAKRIVDEEMRFSIIVNGDVAQKELYGLEKSTRDLTARNKELRQEKVKLFTQGKQESAAYKALTAEIKTNNSVISLNKSRMSELQKQIGITGLTMAQLKNKARELSLQLRNMVPGSAEYKRFHAELQGVNAQLTKLKVNGQSSSLTLGGIANGFNKYAALGASVIATLTGIVFSIQKVIDYSGKLSDAMSDVQKTTGMTANEVEELSKGFGLLETRTSRIDLLKIAEEGGRIGIVKEEIADFVEVMNKAVVALSDSFPGGAEETAAKLGKLKLLFKETKDQGVDKAYNAIGSAINELGANGVATESNIANFATRVGSLSDALKPTIADALALGAAFEENGIQAEIAGRAYSILLNQAATESAKFAEVMGITNAEVQKLINDDPLEFLMNFAKGLKGMSATDTANTLQYLGVSADGANKVLGALANNTDRFRELLDLSNRSMIEGTSLINEYNIKNNNFAAIMEKLNKSMSDLFLKGSLARGIQSVIIGLADLLGVADDVNEAFEKEVKQTLELAKANREAANSSAILLEEYESLTEDGIEPTSKAKERLDEITLLLKDRLGDSVVAIDKETGAFLLNTEAVRDQIRLKRLAADQEASTFASRLKGAQDAQKELQRELSQAKKISETRERLAVKAREDFSPNRSDTRGRLQEIQNVPEIKAARDATADLNRIQEKINENLAKQKLLRQSLAELDYDDSILELAFGATEPSGGPSEGETKTVGGVKFVFTNGQWVKVNTFKPISGDPAKDTQRKSLLDYERATEDARLEIIADSFRKELELQRVAHERKMADLQGQKVTGVANATEINAEINKQLEIEEENHLLKIATIYEKGVADKYKNVQSDFEAEKQIRQTAHNNEIAQLGNNDKAVEALDKKFKLDELVRHEAHLNELLADIEELKAAADFGGMDLSLLTPEQVQQFSALADELKLKLSELGIAKSSLSSPSAIGSDAQAQDFMSNEFGNVDIFGFSPEMWAQTFDSLDTTAEKMQAIIVVTQAMAQAYAMYSDFVNRKNQVELQNFQRAQDDKKDSLQRNLESGFINQRQYNDSVRAIEEQTENARAEAAYKQAKNEKAQALISVAMNTAAAIMSIWAQVPKFDFGISAGILTGIVGGLGAIQAGVIAATPLPAKGFEQGFYGNMPVQREQDGKLFNASYGGKPTTQMVDKPKYFLAGERGKDFPEMIIDGKSFSRFRPDFKDSLYRELGRVRGFENGYYPKNTEQNSGGNSFDDTNLLVVLSRITTLLDSLDRNGVNAYLKRNLQTAKELRDDIKDYENLRNKNKV